MAEDQRSTLEASLCVARKISSVIDSVGKITLPQHRAQSILDIAGRVVQAESIGEFLNEMSPYSCSGDKRRMLWRRMYRNQSNNPFYALAKADDMMTKVRVVMPFATENLTPEMGLGLRIQHKPTGGGGREVLRDRELSEFVNSLEAASTTTQAGRMGTAEFMSANLLDHADRPVKVFDELESFFRLFVYCSVRHLRSNCRARTASWIDNYFCSYTGPERMICRGEKSCAVEVSGTLQMRYPDRASVTFRSPMDDVLAPILKRFRAYYKVMEHDAANARPSPRPETSLPPLASTAPSILLRDYDEDDEDVHEEEIAEREAELQASLRAHIPTTVDRELAKAVADHELMLGHLAKMLHDPQWRANDRIPGPAPPKVPSTKSNPNEQPSEPGLREENSNKRQRRSGPERNVSLPARLRATTRRSPRKDARTDPLRARR